ncbi:MAG: hypothetical protein R3A10_08715 [Caldilineaceae bacterium]
MITESLPKRYGDPGNSPERDGGRPKTATDRISDIVLTLRTPGWWWLGFAVSLALLLSLVYLITTRRIFLRGGNLGHQRSGRLGHCDHQPGLLDRHRPRRHIDFGHPPAHAAGNGADH